MRDWLTIQFEKSNDLHLIKFIEDNHLLDMTMRRVLANYLNLSEPSVEMWIHDYQRTASEHSQLYINVAIKIATTLNVSNAFIFCRNLYTHRPL